MASAADGRQAALADDEEVSGEKSAHEKAVDAFLKQAELEIERRDAMKASENLGKALKRVEKHADHPARGRWEAQLRSLKLHLSLLELFMTRTVPFERRFRVYSSETTSPIAFRCLHGLTRLVRDTVFCKELSIPPAVEFDSRDARALHGMVLVGDDPRCVSRTWLAQGASGLRWAVLDRLATLCIRGKGDASYTVSHRGKGHATYMVKQLGGYLAQNGVKVLVIHLFIRSNSKLLLALLKKGARFVLTESEVRRQQGEGQAEKPPLVFVEDGELRINTIHLWLPLPGATQVEVEATLEEVRQHSRAMLALPDDPVNRMRTRELLFSAGYLSRSASTPPSPGDAAAPS
jgi:hypothetical protein